MSQIVISHEHPDSFKPLLAELEKRVIPYETVDPTQHNFAIDGDKPDIALFFNRMSSSAYLCSGVQGTFFTLNYLKHLEEHGIKVINSYKALTYVYLSPF
jgi:hypothetical protein